MKKTDAGPTPFTDEAMRARFKWLTEQRDAILAKTAPLEQAYTEADAAYYATVNPIVAQLKELRAPLFDIDQERAALVRALKGATEDPAAVAERQKAAAEAETATKQ
jgi:hypothetical protein